MGRKPYLIVVLQPAEQFSTQPTTRPMLQILGVQLFCRPIRHSSQQNTGLRQSAGWWGRALECQYEGLWPIPIDQSAYVQGQRAEYTMQ
jgi:hypothetical protein